MKTYPVCEHFYSLQGEGANVGKPAYFLRLSGCPVRCSFCDSANAWNEKAGEPMAASDMVELVKKSGAQNVVITGGEPLIHHLGELCEAFRTRLPKVYLWLETSGTAAFSGDFDHVCLSPKKHALPLPENYAKANELKVIIENSDDFKFAETQALQVNPTCQLFLQAEWSAQKNIAKPLVDYILEHPKWRLSVQTHKFMGIL